MLTLENASGDKRLTEMCIVTRRKRKKLVINKNTIEIHYKQRNAPEFKF